MEPQNYSIVMFDGVCNFCNGLVTWIIERDPKGKFKFCSLQSEIGHEYLDKYKLPKDLSTIVLIEPGNHTYTKSDAVFRILSQLDSPFAYLSFLRYTPRCIRDLGYDIFGSLRYVLFGKGKESCSYNPNWRSRFLTIDEDPNVV